MTTFDEGLRLQLKTVQRQKGRGKETTKVKP